MNGCNWVAQSEEDDGGGVGAGEKDVVALQLKIFTNSFVFVFLYLMYVSGSGRMGGMVIYGAVTMIEFFFLLSGLGGAAAACRRFGLGWSCMAQYDVLMVLRWSESVSYVSWSAL